MMQAERKRLRAELTKRGGADPVESAEVNKEKERERERGVGEERADGRGAGNRGKRVGGDAKGRKREEEVSRAQGGARRRIEEARKGGMQGGGGSGSTPREGGGVEEHWASHLEETRNVKNKGEEDAVKGGQGSARGYEHERFDADRVLDGGGVQRVRGSKGSAETGSRRRNAADDGEESKKKNGYESSSGRGSTPPSPASSTASNKVMNKVMSSLPEADPPVMIGKGGDLLAKGASDVAAAAGTPREEEEEEEDVYEEVRDRRSTPNPPKNGYMWPFLDAFLTHV